MDQGFPDYGFEAIAGAVPVAGVARRLAILEELTDMAMALARIAQRHALREAEEANAAAPPERTTPLRRDATLAFTRLARVVRTCVALEERIASGEPGRAEAEPPPKPAQPFDWRRDRRLQVIRRAFQHAAAEQYGTGGDGNGRWLKMLTLVESDAFREALEAGPNEGRVAAAVAGVAAETGLTIDWARDLDAALIDFSPYRRCSTDADSRPAPW